MTDEDLMNKAKEVSANAHTPYTGFAVGAAVLMSDGKVFTGCNVETSSYGSSLCAERNAMAAAIASGHKDVVKVAIYSPDSLDVIPCGTCRQWLLDFAGDNDITILTQAENGLHTYTIKQLLPHPYNSKS
jgi:cytidine deaminase